MRETPEWYDSVYESANQHDSSVNDADMAALATFPEPVTPSVAINPSRPWLSLGAKTPRMIEETSTPSKTSNWVASSSKTRVKANFSTALRLESTGGARVIRLGIPCGSSSDGSSTVRNRSEVDNSGNPSNVMVDVEADGFRRR